MSSETGGGSYSDADRAADAILALTQQALTSGEAHRVPDAIVRRLMTVAIKLYAAKVNGTGRAFRPVEGKYDEVITPTEALTAATEILRAVGLGAMEFGLWAHRHRDSDDALDDRDPRR